MKNEERKGSTEKILQLVGFKVENEEFAVDILSVQEIIKMQQITEVPNSPEFVEGIINLRGKVIPVIDIRTRLGLEKKEFGSTTRIIVIEVSSKIVGFVVDEVTEVIRISSSIIEAPPAMVGGISSNYITAIGKMEDRLLILLDLDKTLSEDEKEQLGDLEK